jgi:hypothetical protein
MAFRDMYIARSGRQTARSLHGHHWPGVDDGDGDAEFIVGGVDSSRYSHSITYTSGDYAPYLAIRVSAILYSSSSLGSTSAVVDTGTTLALLSQSVYSKFLSASGGRSDSETGQAKFSKKPTSSLTPTIGGTQFSLSPHYLISSDL